MQKASSKEEPEIAGGLLFMLLSWVHCPRGKIQSDSPGSDLLKCLLYGSHRSSRNAGSLPPPGFLAARLTAG